MKDVRVSVQMQNNQILARMDEKHLTVERLLQHMGYSNSSNYAFHKHELEGLIDMTVSPRKTEVMYKEIALSLADELGTTVHVLFGHVLKREDLNRKTNNDFRLANFGDILNFKRKV